MIDIIIVNAGIAQSAAFESVQKGVFGRFFDINVKGVFFAVQKGLPSLNDKGAIVPTGSIAAIKGLLGMRVYSAAKAAVGSFARTWANCSKATRLQR